MHIRQIETFLSVAESGSFRRAAEILHRSVSVVSTHVQQLEDELGVPLLERTTRRVSLTPSGYTLFVRARSLMADLTSIVQELRDEASLQRGRVSIGSAPSISAHRLPPIIASYQAQYPQIALELHESFAHRMYGDVLERVTDFAIGPRLDGFKDCDISPVIIDPIVAVLPSNKQWKGRKTIKLEEISREPHLSMPKGTAIRHVIEEAFKAKSLIFAPTFEVVHQQTLFSLVEAGLGVTVLPLMSVPPERSAKYVVAHLQEPSITREISLVTLKGKVLSPAAQRCAEMVVAELQRHFRKGRPQPT